MKTSYIYPAALAIVFIILGGVYVTQQATTTVVLEDSVSEAVEEPTTTPPMEAATKSATKVVLPTPTPEKVPTPAPAPASNAHTLAEVSLHATKANCWSVVRGVVYDLTPWIAKHPGGAGAILSMCGKDATNAFEGQHGGQRRPEAELAGFEIGVLK